MEFLKVVEAQLHLIFGLFFLLCIAVRKNILTDSPSPSILVRSRKSPSILCGLRVVDVLFPVAKGQRELVIGDRQSGKSAIFICAQVAQKSQNNFVVTRRKIFSVVSASGGRLSTSVRFLRIYARTACRADVAFLAAGITDLMGSQFLAHLSAAAVLENSRNRGLHHQAGFDDLSKHAVAYRQMCLFFA